MAGNPTLPTENIDEVILRLLALEPNEVEELDYETYKSYLKELLVEVTAAKRKIGDDEFNSIKNEFKRVRGKKGRFKIKKTKISADGLGLGGIRKQIKGTQKRLMLAPVGGVPKSQEKIEDISKKTKENPLLKISETLDSILSTLTDIGKQDIKEREKNRRSEEEKKRTGRESSLESKTFDGLKKVISAVTKPFQSIWDKIVNFIFYTFLGRVVVKLFDWFADPKNQGKVKSIIRFVKDWWPALLGSYILFGTKFGGLIRFVGGWAVRLAFQLGKVVIPKLLAFIAKNPFAALAVAGGVGAYAATQQNKARRDEFAKTDQTIVKPEETAKTGRGPGPLQLQQEQIGQQGLGLGFSGGGAVRLPGFAGGGFNFGNMMGGAAMGSMFGPLGMLLGGAFGSGKPQEMASGFVSGEKGVDKIPAMLSDGEFVMSAGAVQKYGVDTLEAMNAAGGGTNKPKIVNGKTHAYGGGRVGRSENPDPPGSSKNDSVTKLRRDFNNFLRGQGAGPNFDIGNPRTWGGGGGGSSSSGGGVGGIIPREIGQGIDYARRTAGKEYERVKGYAGQGINAAGKEYERGKKYVSDTYNQAINDPRVRQVVEAADQGRKFISKEKKKAIDYGIKKGYLNEKGEFSGAAKKQATNFLSDLLPNLPGVNSLNKKLTENYLKNIGLTREKAKYGDMSSQALLTGKSGIDSAYNIGQMQLNKMSKESKKIYMDILKERMKSGTLKSGDVINPYGKVDKSDPRYREQGNVRFYVDPKTGKGYLLDTYGFDPGKVDLGKGAAQKQYEDQVKTFQDPKKKIKLGPLDIPIGKIAKKLDLRPMQDATEGGGLPQYILALRNKIFPYDAKKEGAKLDPKRFKTKAQIDELKELGDLKKFASKQLTPQQKKLIDEKLKKEKVEKEKKLFEKKNFGAKLYNKPQKNTKQPYKSKFARPKNAGKTPVKPSPKPKPKVTVAGGGQGGGRGSGAKPSTKQKAPSPSPRHPKHKGSASAYGIMK